MSDTSKTNRSFQCRDALWEKFEQMARELECSVDYLVNDAMKQYARQRGYGSTKGFQSSSHASLSPPIPPGAGASPPVAPPPPGFSGRTRLGPPPVPPGVGTPLPIAPPPPPGVSAHTAPPPPPYVAAHPPPLGRVASAPPPLPASPIAPGRSSAPPSHGAPPPRPRHSVGARRPPPAPSMTRGARQALNIYYMGERFPINKDRFIIGRGRQSSDLTIKDPNVSRQHAMVEFMNGQYFVVDMGSTNGVEYAGQRVQRQVVNEGDTFRVCDHELRFSYH